jgi:hypothetical protein
MYLSHMSLGYIIEQFTRSSWQLQDQRQAAPKSIHKKFISLTLILCLRQESGGLLDVRTRWFNSINIQTRVTGATQWSEIRGVQGRHQQRHCACESCATNQIGDAEPQKQDGSWIRLPYRTELGVALEETQYFPEDYGGKAVERRGVRQ